MLSRILNKSTLVILREVSCLVGLFSRTSSFSMLGLRILTDIERVFTILMFTVFIFNEGFLYHHICVHSAIAKLRLCDGVVGVLDDQLIVLDGHAVVAEALDPAHIMLRARGLGGRLRSGTRRNLGLGLRLDGRKVGRVAHIGVSLDCVGVS